LDAFDPTPAMLKIEYVARSANVSRDIDQSLAAYLDRRQ
jgi:hypothetical protein